MLESRRVIFRQPVRKQLVDRCRLEDVPGNNVIADLARFFQQEDAKLFISSFIREFFQLYGRSQTRGTLGR